MVTGENLTGLMCLNTIFDQWVIYDEPKKPDLKKKKIKLRKIIWKRTSEAAKFRKNRLHRSCSVITKQISKWPNKQ